MSKKLYAIEACESQYQGLHGMVSHFLTECNNFDEACAEAHGASEDIIYEYGLEPNPDEDEEWDDADWADAWAEAVMYSVWEVPDLKGHPVRELDRMFYDDPEGFIAEYCVDVE